VILFIALPETKDNIEPHSSVRGTSTLMNNALLSAHFLFAD
jgi:hypothetical protein